MKSIELPLTDACIRDLRAGDTVLISGIVFSARDAAHKRMAEALEQGESLPIDIRNQTIYYLGPAPAKPGYACGAAGPTSSYRMDPYTPRLLELGLKGMIGKGYRSEQVIEAIRKHNAVYFAAVGGIAALLAKTVVSNELVAYGDLGTEAIRKLVLKDFPATVIVDCYGTNQYEAGQKAFTSMEI